MSAAEEVARIRRAELAGVITCIEAQILEAAAWDGRPTGMVHALGRLPLADLQARWLQARPEHGTGAVVYLPPSREQLIAAILDRVS